jgi:hypothetical protein
MAIPHRTWWHACSRPSANRDFVNAPANIDISDNEIAIRLFKRAHNPILLAAGLGGINTPIPWLGGKRIRLIFG